MKKLTFITALAAIFSSCFGPEGPQGPQGIPGRDGTIVNTFVKDFTIFSADWQLLQEGDASNAWNIFQYEFSEPKISDYTLEEGIVQVFFYQTLKDQNGNEYLSQTPLPFTVYGQDDKGILFEETYTYEISNGYINFVCRNNHSSANLKPLDRDFHLIITQK